MQLVEWLVAAEAMADCPYILLENVSWPLEMVALVGVVMVMEEVDEQPLELLLLVHFDEGKNFQSHSTKLCCPKVC